MMRRCGRLDVTGGLHQTVRLALALRRSSALTLVPRSGVTAPIRQRHVGDFRPREWARLPGDHSAPPGDAQKAAALVH